MLHDKNNLTHTLKHADPKRRGFLMKLLAGGAALPVMSTIAFADDDKPAGKGKGGRGKGKSGKGKGGKGKGGQPQGGQQRGAFPKPAEMAEEMIKKFDKDGDKALNITELTAALTAMQERMAARRGRRGNGQGAGGAGKGKGKGSQGVGAQGVVPKRP